MLKQKSSRAWLVLAFIAVGLPLTIAVADEDEKSPKPVMLGGEWDPEEKLKDGKVERIQYRGCLVNKTWSPLTLTIVRPTYSTTFNLAAGGHYRVMLDKGEGLFVSGDPQSGTIISFKKHDVAGETTVYVKPNDVKFVRGVNDCIQHD